MILLINQFLFNMESSINFLNLIFRKAKEKNIIFEFNKLVWDSFMLFIKTNLFNFCQSLIKILILTYFLHNFQYSLLLLEVPNIFLGYKVKKLNIMLTNQIIYIELLSILMNSPIRWKVQTQWHSLIVRIREKKLPTKFFTYHFQKFLPIQENI